MQIFAASIKIIANKNIIHHLHSKIFFHCDASRGLRGPRKTFNCSWRCAIGGAYSKDGMTTWAPSKKWRKCFQKGKTLKWTWEDIQIWDACYMFDYMILCMLINLHEGSEGYILRNASCKVVSIFSTKASVSYVHNGYQRQGSLTITQATSTSTKPMAKTRCFLRPLDELQEIWPLAFRWWDWHPLSSCKLHYLRTKSRTKKSCQSRTNKVPVC